MQKVRRKSTVQRKTATQRHVEFTRGPTSPGGANSASGGGGESFFRAAVGGDLTSFQIDSVRHDACGCSTFLARLLLTPDKVVLARVSNGDEMSSVHCAARLCRWLSTVDARYDVARFPKVGPPVVTGDKRDRARRGRRCAGAGARRGRRTFAEGNAVDAKASKSARALALRRSDRRRLRLRIGAGRFGARAQHEVFVCFACR